MQPTRKISELGDGGLLQATDALLITRGAGNYKVTGNNIIAYASKSVKGVTQLATSTEYFNKDDTKTITPNDIANDVRLAKFSVANGVTGLTQVVAVGTTYNMLTSLLTANEVSNTNIPIIYKNTANATQNTILDEINHKFL